MTFCADKTVRELAVETPNATRVFEKLKIDYCCGGGRSLGEACAAAGVEVAEVERLLEAAGSTAATPAAAQSGMMSELIDYIVEKHHTFTRDEMKRVAALADKVAAKHGGNHPELLEVRDLFARLCEDLRPHMLKEEAVLFPYIKQLEQAAAAGGPSPYAPFGTVAYPVRMMMLEHDTAGEILRELRAASGDYTAPDDGCISYRTLYGALEELEADLHQHIHLENNVLFPRAAGLEQETRAGR